MVYPIVRFIGILLAQLLLFNSLSLWDLAYPQVFIVTLLFLPLNYSRSVEYLLAFALGFLVDLILNPLGAHSFTCVLFVGLRHLWIGMITPQVNEEEMRGLVMENQPISWIISYLIPLIFIYELVYSALVDFSFNLNTLLKALSSGIYTSILCLLITFLLYYKKAKA